MAPQTTLFPVHEATLSNGLRVRLVPDHDAPVASLYTFFQVGSRNERPGITGISHLFEHMMFNGAAKYGPKEFDEVLESSGGRSNAYTTHDVTVYYEDFAADALDTVLDLESDRMRSLTIDDRSLSREREVVKEERRMRVENEPAGPDGRGPPRAGLPGPPLPLAGHRLHGGHRGHRPEGLRGLLPHLLRPGQRRPLAGR